MFKLCRYLKFPITTLFVLIVISLTNTILVDEQRGVNSTPVEIKHLIWRISWITNTCSTRWVPTLSR